MTIPMNSEEFNELWDYVEERRPGIEAALRANLPLAPAHVETKFNDALEYALFPGGKRFRPVLTLLGAELAGGNAEEMLPAAAAVEFIHTSSLIFDDLPCMDNASERRKKPSLHEEFGEGLAVLVGLGLLNASYPLVFVNHAGSPEKAIQAHGEIVECIGAGGMVGGQSVDLALVNGDDITFGGDLTDGESIRNLKTSALMRLALRTGAILAGATYIELAALSRFAELLGDAYQLSDDLIDLEEDEEIFSEQQKTLAIEKGENAARAKLQSTIDEAKRVLVDNFASSRARTVLVQLTDYLAERNA
ncbi:MAG: polyprenyl synthetase family protein [Acidobacteria bacterium]|nr:MAG: polyprenyl synthetase family protein [Acidobacteriota bacterium]REK01879.1 MAG: polyprenyl synthetase family protein [Acidobacteriota bacterium]REK14835.1 MAG: polyprenyl synthetase family protein [Acidobacteriota bacterium]REK45550.1 MAG: polyprenyl synthetase family protein [Acidobacteriota bacterium]